MQSMPFTTEPPRHATRAAPSDLKARNGGIDRFNADVFKAEPSPPDFQLREPLQHRDVPADLIGEGAAMRAVKDLISRVGPTDSAVFIEGETGAGKELVAHAIHKASGRAGGPFVAVNCAAFQEPLLENELFGHARGAYTGATEERPGLFEVAHRGTLFLDEVGEMSPALQAKLLRVLDRGEFQRLGDPKVRKADFRVIGATNCDLRKEVRNGAFREDLYYRLNVVAIKVPPLRDRPEDIPLLVAHFLRRNRAGRLGERVVTVEALDALSQYPWPGNVRELANVVERAIIFSAGREITGEAIAALLPDRNSPQAAETDDRGLTLEMLERRHIAQVLNAEGGNRVRTARALGISLRNLYRKINRHGLRILDAVPARS